MAKRTKEPALGDGAEKPSDPLLDAPVAVDPPSEAPVPVQAPAPDRSGPTFGQRLGGCFWFLVRVTLSVIVLSLFVLALFFGLSLLNDQTLVPAGQDPALIAELRTRQEQTEQRLADLQTKLDTLETLQNEQDSSLTRLDQRLGAIEKEIAARTESLEALEKIQAELEEQQTGLKEQNEAGSVELERQVMLLKSMELLSRAHLLLYQSNFGLARRDVQGARDLLVMVQPDAREPLASELEEVILRLDLALGNLPDFPVAASDDLDIAWQILISGLPEETPTTLSPTFTPTPPSLASGTPTRPVTSTPTPSTASTVTATP